MENIAVVEVMERRNIIGAISLDAQLLLERLLKVKEEEIIGYKELSNVIHRSVQKEGYRALTTARKKAQEEHKIVFYTVPKFGLIRLNNNEIIDKYSDSFLKKIKRINKKNRKLMSCVDFDGLEMKNKIKYQTNLTLSYFLGASLEESRIKKIEFKVKEVKDKISFDKVLSEFMTN